MQEIVLIEFQAPHSLDLIDPVQMVFFVCCMITEEFGNQRRKRICVAIFQVRRPLPVVQIGHEVVVDGVEVDVGDECFQVVAVMNLLSFEVFDKQGAPSHIYFIEGLGIAAEEIGKLFTDNFVGRDCGRFFE